ncbi:MAG: GAF domain-containing protein [Thermoleophilia bacterium]|nr:GAF domain-containing protein [Thermoleophilia bacterium]
MGGTPSVEEKLEAVIKGAHAILEKRQFVDTARAIFDRCRELTGAVSGYVALLSADGHENEVLFLEAGGMPCLVDPSLPMPIRGLRAVAYESHKVVFNNDFMNSPWVNYLPGGHVEMRNVMFAPLNVDGATVGIMGLANKPSDFTQEDADIATVFGELATIALLNSRHMELLAEKTAALEQALSEVRTLRGLLPMCSRCHKIRDDAGLWTQVEQYLTEHTDALVSHGLCPDCLREFFPDEADEILEGS